MASVWNNWLLKILDQVLFFLFLLDVFLETVVYNCNIYLIKNLFFLFVFFFDVDIWQKKLLKFLFSHKLSLLVQEIKIQKMLVFWFIEKLSNLYVALDVFYSTADSRAGRFRHFWYHASRLRGQWAMGMDQKAGEGRGCANEFRP